MAVVDALEKSGEPLSPAVREALVTLLARVRELEEENALLRRRIGELEPLVVKLQARIRELEARLGLDSTNSSKPPSSDPPHRKPKRSKRPSGRKRGAQPGHRGAHRMLLPTGRVDAAREHRPAVCRHCGTSLEGAAEVGAPGLHQVIELPPVRAHVTEHRTVTCICPRCRRRTKAKLPAGLRGKHFGPRLVAFSAMLMSRFRMSRRQLAAFLGDLLDVEAPALGTTQAFVHEAAAALLAPYGEIRRAVRRARVANADETGWWLRDLRRWLWVAVSQVGPRRAAFFRLGRRRGAADACGLLGSAFGGILVTDRYAAYNGHPDARRQFCWAHLERTFRGLAGHGGEGGHLGALAVRECRRLFDADRRYRAGELTHAELRGELAPLRARFTRLLRRGARSDDPKARALSRSLLRRRDCLWTFLRHEGVPTTNNAAERALRGAVIHRKLSFGSKSGQGMRFLERIFSVNETCRMNDTDILDYLTRAIVAHRAAAPAPRLLPSR